MTTIDDIYNENVVKKGAVVIDGHVQGLSNTRALGKFGVPVIVVDENNCTARYSKYCKQFYKCPPFTKDELTDFLIELACEKDLKGWLLLPSNDHAVLTIARNRERLIKYFKLISPGNEDIGMICDKYLLLQRANSVSIPIPATYRTEHVELIKDRLIYPLLIKGKFGLDFYKALGRKVIPVRDFSGLIRQLNKIEKRFPVEKAYIQELIPDNGENKVLSVCSFSVEGEVKAYWMGQKIREHPERFGTATFVKSVFEEQCLIQSKLILREFKYTGVCEVEFVKDPRDNRYKLIEINPRTWLWVELARYCGVDFAKLIYKYANGEVIEYPDDYALGKYWINPVTDTAISLVSIMKGKLSFKEYLKDIMKRDKVDALFQKGDIKPGFFYALNLFPMILKR